MSAKEVMRYTGLVVLSILLVLSLLTALATTSARIYLSPEVYKETFAKNQFYNSLVKSVSKEATSQDFSQVIPKEELERQGNTLIEELLSYARSEKDQPNLTITFDNGFIKKSLEKKITELPTCLANQQSIQESDVVCRPVGISNEALLSQALSTKGISLDRPLSIDLKQYIDKEDKLHSFRDAVSMYKTTRLLAWILVAVCLVAIGFFASGISSKMRWVGLPLVIAGIMCFLLQGVIVVAIADALYPQINQLLQSTISDLLAPFTSSLTIYGITAGIIGLLIFGGSFFFRKTTESQKK